ncbi:MAG: glycosyltransferase, partial [Bacteroidales bacterium]|nr:glycosyltransferase [Bacteroidales bacterium]
RLSVSPMYSGAGTSIKLLEALQRNRVCVTTRFGFRGAESFFEAGNDVPVADNDDAFAELVVKALTDSSFNRQVAENAYEKVGKTFSHGKFFEIVEAALS